jgi:hypothetical protein
MLFKKTDSANLVSKSNKYWKNRPQKTKKAQNVVFNLKSRVPLLFYCAKHIHGQFKTYLKLENSLQTNSKNYPDCWKKPWYSFLKQFCFVSYIEISICTILFLLICRVFIVLYGVLTLCFTQYCVFETCKVKSLLKLLYFERYSIIVLHFILPNFSAISWTN